MHWSFQLGPGLPNDKFEQMILHCWTKTKATSATLWLLSALILGSLGLDHLLSHTIELKKGVSASPLGSLRLKDRCGMSPCNGPASCPEGCTAKLLHASKTGDNLLSNEPHQLKQGLLLRLKQKWLPIRWIYHCSGWIVIEQIQSISVKSNETSGHEAHTAGCTAPNICKRNYAITY